MGGRRARLLLQPTSAYRGLTLFLSRAYRTNLFDEALRFHNRQSMCDRMQTKTTQTMRARTEKCRCMLVMVAGLPPSAAAAFCL